MTRKKYPHIDGEADFDETLERNLTKLIRFFLVGLVVLFSLLGALAFFLK